MRVMIVRAIKHLVAAGFRLASKPCNIGERLTRYAMYQSLAKCVRPFGHSVCRRPRAASFR
jgi:hypothetical protein